MTDNDRAPVEAALDAWRRFDSEVPDALLRAVCGAFALVACADGEVDDTEIERFLGMVAGNEAFAALDTPTLEAVFRDLSQAILDDFDGGQRRALLAIKAVAGDPSADLVVAAARIAIVADERLLEVEEVALGRICHALGMDPTGV